MDLRAKVFIERLVGNEVSPGKKKVKSGDSSSSNSNNNSIVVVVVVGGRSFIGTSAAEDIHIHFLSISPQGHWSVTSATSYCSGMEVKQKVKCQWLIKIKKVTKAWLNP